MKINSDISAPVYLELVCKKGIETDNVIDEMTELASLFKVPECFQLQGIVDSVMDNEKSVIIISVDILPNTPKGEDALSFIKAFFETFFNYYPKYTEPI
jgi:hypothetical protein